MAEITASVKLAKPLGAGDRLIVTIEGPDPVVVSVPTTTPPPSAAFDYVIDAASLTVAAFMAILKDGTRKRVGVRDGTIRWPGGQQINGVLRASNPVSIEPLNPGGVTFDGSSGGGWTLWGKTSPVSGIAVRGFGFTGYTIDQTGMIWIANGSQLDFSGSHGTVRGASASLSGSHHVAYLSQADSGSARQADLVFDDCDFDGVSRWINFLHSYHNSGFDRISVKRLKVRNLNKGFLIWPGQKSTGLVLEDGTLANLGQPADLSTVVDTVGGVSVPRLTGSARNMVATGFSPKSSVPASVVQSGNAW